MGVDGRGVGVGVEYNNNGVKNKRNSHSLLLAYLTLLFPSGCSNTYQDLVSLMTGATTCIFWKALINDTFLSTLCAVNVRRFVVEAASDVAVVIIF